MQKNRYQSLATALLQPIGLSALLLASLVACSGQGAGDSSAALGGTASGSNSSGSASFDVNSNSNNATARSGQPGWLERLLSDDDEDGIANHIDPAPGVTAELADPESPLFIEAAYSKVVLAADSEAVKADRIAIEGQPLTIELGEGGGALSSIGLIALLHGEDADTEVPIIAVDEHRLQLDIALETATFDSFTLVATHWRSDRIQLRYLTATQPLITSASKLLANGSISVEGLNLEGAEFELVATRDRQILPVIVTAQQPTAVALAAPSEQALAAAPYWQLIARSAAGEFNGPVLEPLRQFSIAAHPFPARLPAVATHAGDELVPLTNGQPTAVLTSLNKARVHRIASDTEDFFTLSQLLIAWPDENTTSLSARNVTAAVLLSRHGNLLPAVEQWQHLKTRLDFLLDQSEADGLINSVADVLADGGQFQHGRFDREAIALIERFPPAAVPENRFAKVNGPDIDDLIINVQVGSRTIPIKQSSLIGFTPLGVNSAGVPGSAGCDSNKIPSGAVPTSLCVNSGNVVPISLSAIVDGRRVRNHPNLSFKTAGIIKLYGPDVLAGGKFYSNVHTFLTTDGGAQLCGNSSCTVELLTGGMASGSSLSKRDRRIVEALRLRSLIDNLMIPLMGKLAPFAGGQASCFAQGLSKAPDFLTAVSDYRKEVKAGATDAQKTELFLSKVKKPAFKFLQGGRIASFDLEDCITSEQQRDNAKKKFSEFVSNNVVKNGAKVATKAVKIFEVIEESAKVIQILTTQDKFSYRIAPAASVDSISPKTVDIDGSNPKITLTGSFIASNGSLSSSGGREEYYPRFELREFGGSNDGDIIAAYQVVKADTRLVNAASQNQRGERYDITIPFNSLTPSISSLLPGRYRMSLNYNHREFRGYPGKTITIQAPSVVLRTKPRLTGLNKTTTPPAQAIKIIGYRLDRISNQSQVTVDLIASRAGATSVTGLPTLFLDRDLRKKDHRTTIAFSSPTPVPAAGSSRVNYTVQLVLGDGSKFNVPDQLSVTSGTKSGSVSGSDYGDRKLDNGRADDTIDYSLVKKNGSSLRTAVSDRVDPNRVGSDSITLSWDNENRFSNDQVGAVKIQCIDSGKDDQCTAAAYIQNGVTTAKERLFKLSKQQCIVVPVDGSATSGC